MAAVTSRRQVDSLTSAQTNVTAQAKRELGQIWMEVQTLPEERRRDALLDLIPALVDKYGDVSGSVAADWYDQIRAAWLESEQLPSDDYHAVAATNPYNASDLHREITYQLNTAADGDDMEHVLDRLNARLDKWIRQAGRDTIISSTANDPRKPRYARVPKGRTCAFCAMLASRGFVYASAETAGSFRKYHEQCDCEIVPSWDAERISGYDPDALYADYLKARDETGKLSPTDSEVLAAMRRHAGQYTDSAGVPDGWKQPHSTNERRILSLRGSLDASDAEWYARQEAVGVPHDVDTLYMHEIVFLERFTKLGNHFAWIPRDTSTAVATNDFLWIEEGEECELKSMTKAEYGKIADRITKAVRSANENHGVVKDCFIIDIGDVRLSDKLARQLEGYNSREWKIRRLFVLSGDGLSEIDLNG